MRALEGQKTEIAFLYPYSYKECQNYMRSLQNRYSKDKEIYFKREILTRSPENRNIDLITLSSYRKIEEELEPLIDDQLFPDRNTSVPATRGARTARARSFSKDKMIVFLSARVHPGETPSSYAMKGIIKFLLNK